MDEPVFKTPTPPPPQMNVPEPPVAEPQPTVVPPVQETVQAQSNPPVENANTSETTEAPAPKKQQILARLDGLKATMVRYFWYSVGGLFLLGAFFGCAMSGSEPAPIQTPQASGISSKVVQNPIKRGKNLKVCGEALASQPCLYYALNTKAIDKVAEDFYDQAARDTQRLVNNIRRDNVTYSKIPIKPGRFAEIIIPST